MLCHTIQRLCQNYAWILHINFQSFLCLENGARQPAQAGNPGGGPCILHGADGQCAASLPGPAQHIVPWLRTVKPGQAHPGHSVSG